MNSKRTHFYLDKTHAKLMGVCSGIADYIGLEVLWVRMAAVVLTIWTGGVTLPAYLAIGILADSRPRGRLSDSDEQEVWRGGRLAPRPGAREFRPSFRDIDRRLANLESYYVSSSSRLSNEIDRLH